MKIFFLLPMLLLLGFFGSLAAQEPLLFEATQIRTLSPENWKIEKTADGIGLVSPNDEIMLDFQEFPESETEEVLQGLERMLMENIEDLQAVGEPDVLDVNGLDLLVSELKGVVDGVEVQIGIFLVEKNNTALLITFMARSDANPKHIKELQLVLGGLHVID